MTGRLTLEGGARAGAAGRPTPSCPCPRSGPTCVPEGQGSREERTSLCKLNPRRASPPASSGPRGTTRGQGGHMPLSYKGQRPAWPWCWSAELSPCLRQPVTKPGLQPKDRPSRAGTASPAGLTGWAHAVPAQETCLNKQQQPLEPLLQCRPPCALVPSSGPALPAPRPSQTQVMPGSDQRLLGLCSLHHLARSADPRPTDPEPFPHDLGGSDGPPPSHPISGGSCPLGSSLPSWVHLHTCLHMPAWLTQAAGSAQV